MTDTKTPDEKPKRQVAKQVVSEKRQYFVPAHGVSVKAKDVDEAVAKAKRKVINKSQTEEEGDA